jgi:prevent-host-death family protein
MSLMMEAIMAAVPNFIPARTVTSKEALRNWKTVTDKALREPVVITSHGRPRHVLLAYEDYERMRDQERQAFRTDELPDALADAILNGLSVLREPKAPDDGDTIIG